jgi:aspartyl-tRNA synthetase
VKQKLKKWKREIDKSIFIAGDVNNSISTIIVTTRQKISKTIGEISNKTFRFLWARW